MSIKITADSTCDLSPELLRRYDIDLIPLSIIKGGAPFKDGLEITPADIARHVDQGGELTTTTAVSVGEYAERFAQLSARYEAVIHINIGSNFSSCYQNACIAAEDYENVYVVDSQNLSTGQGHVVVQAALAVEAGVAPADIVAFLRGLIPRVEASFIINRLDYLAKGGRCSTVTALGANLLKLKPCIDVKSGQMEVTGKFRGNFEKCALEYVRQRLKNRSDLELDRIFITHSVRDPAVVEAVRQEITKYAPFQEILETRAGCTIFSHCGPDTLGILFLRNC